MMDDRVDGLRRVHLDGALLPQTWCGADAAGTRLFNPSLVADGAGYIAAFRTIDPAGRRRFAVCRLDAGYRVVGGSSTPFSDEVRFAPGLAVADHSRAWFADPRLFVLDHRLFVVWNDGIWEQRNSQFLAEVSMETLAPAAAARRIMHRDGQFRPEKNWMLFSHQNVWRAVYAISPHRVLILHKETDQEVIFREDATTTYDSQYAHTFGEKRGGAQPVKRSDVYYNFCHSCYGEKGERIYVGTVYTFEAKPPFRVIAETRRPLTFEKLSRPVGHERLNPHVRSVVYPSGAVDRGDRWVIGYGVDDASAEIAELDAAVIDAALEPVSRPALSKVISLHLRERLRSTARRAIWSVTKTSHR